MVGHFDPYRPQDEADDWFSFDNVTILALVGAILLFFAGALLLAGMHGFSLMREWLRG